jgi:alpha-D-xyloside xylohydrolase
MEVMSFDASGDRLEWVGESEVLRVEPWGTDGLRVRAARDVVRDDLPGALLPHHGAGTVTVDGGVGRVTAGRITAEVNETGLVRFLRTDTGAELLAEHPARVWWPGPRFYAGDRLEQRFRGYEGERLYGLGQHVHGRLDQKGCVIDLVQRNGEVSIPFLLSGRGYGLLWNSPAAGRVELGFEATRWVAEGAPQIDYWITAGEGPAGILRRYAEATGLPPMLPEWAAGFWQSKLRYRNQDELLAVAREHRRRGLPLSVIVCDFFHWPATGTWRFDPADWPDPAAMVRELSELGVRLAVSIWPTVSQLSEHFDRMRRAGYLLRTVHGGRAEQEWPEKVEAGTVRMAYHDASHPAARRFLWERVREGYYQHGIRVWWLDACEPDLDPELLRTVHYAAGPGRLVGNAYPLWHAQGFYEGMREAGEAEIVLLIRSAWAGSQRYGTLLWSGDIPATFESLAVQVRAGLNVALSGIPWWTTDIGGFHGGDPRDPDYRELLVRWFQYGVFCPITRLHGDREPRQLFSTYMTGGPNEVWSYGEEAYEILAAQLWLRERLKPYLLRQMEVAHREGLPPMRPLFVDFPDDPGAWQVDDQFLLGPDLLVAPVTAGGVRERKVYLPAGTDWRDAWTGTRHAGGAEVTAAAPLDRIPVFVRNGSSVILSAPRVSP